MCFYATICNKLDINFISMRHVNGLCDGDGSGFLKRGLLTFVWVLQSVFKIIMLNYQASDDLPATFLACPKKGGAKEGHRLTILLSEMFGRPRYISETRASPSDSLKCLTLGLNLMTGMFAWEEANGFRSFYPNPACPRSGPTKFWGTGLGLKEASRRADAPDCLHPALTSASARVQGV
jgi:hypothetical protein